MELYYFSYLGYKLKRRKLPEEGKSLFMRCMVTAITLFVTLESSAQQTLVPWRKYFAGELKPWVATFSGFWLKNFRKSETRKFENNVTHELNELRSFYKIYKPILTFSKDGTKFIDIYSYDLGLEKKGNVYVANVAGEQEIDLCDLTAKQWIRILFFGFSQGAEEVVWIDTTRFIIVGTDLNDQDKRIPFVIIGNIKTQTMDFFTTINKKCISVKGYNSRKLDRIKIVDL